MIVALEQEVRDLRQREETLTDQLCDCAEVSPLIHINTWGAGRGRVGGAGRGVHTSISTGL